MKSNRGQNVRFVVSSLLFVTSLLRPVVLAPNFLNFAVSSCHFVASSHRPFAPLSSFPCFDLSLASPFRLFDVSFRRFVSPIWPRHNQLQKYWDNPKKNDLSYFKSLLVTGLWDIIQTSLHPSIPRCSSKSWAWASIACSFDKGRRGITSTRSWTDHLSQNTAQCLKIFCNCL